LQWIDTYGDCDGSGFVQYQQRASKGLVQQGWKDSQDSVFHADGRMAEPPIALCEVQGYAYAAKRAGALLARAVHEPDHAAKLDAAAEELQAKFEESFWCEEMGTYALALDGQKKQCRVSNAGQHSSAKRQPEQPRSRPRSLMEENSFCGWGFKTVAACEGTIRCCTKQRVRSGRTIPPSPWDFLFTSKRRQAGMHELAAVWS
jgi:glycogen debranching enzyme